MQTRHGRWIRSLAASLVLSMIALPALVGAQEPSEGVVAMVNGSAITKAELDNELKQAQERFPGIGARLSDAQMSMLKKRALEELIDSELLYQQSQKEGIEVDEAALDERIEAMKKQLRRKMAVDSLIEKKFSVSDEEIRAHYDNNPTRFKQPERVQASHILIKTDPKAGESQKEEARKKIEEIQAKLQEGADFAALAKEFSECPSAARGGDLGYFARGRMVKPFEDAAFAMERGGVSDIVETRFGYHLIKVVDKKPETTLAFEDVKDDIEQRLKQQKIRVDVRRYIQGLKEEAEVERFLTDVAQ